MTYMYVYLQIVFKKEEKRRREKGSISMTFIRDIQLNNTQYIVYL